jgi:hypothetical protein
LHYNIQKVKYQVIVKGLERDTFWTFTRSYFLPYFKNLVLNCRQSLSDHDSIIFVLFRGVFTELFWFLYRGPYYRVASIAIYILFIFGFWSLHWLILVGFVLKSLCDL